MGQRGGGWSNDGVGHSRALIVAGVVLTGVCAAVLLVPAQGLTAALLVYVGCFLVTFVVGIAGLAIQLRAKAVRSRLALPLRFVETNSGLAAAAGAPAVVAAVVPTTGLVCLLASSTVPWRAAREAGVAAFEQASIAVWAVAVVLTLAVVIPSVVYAWRGIAFEVNPVGVRTVGPLFDRLIPWQSLAYGGPPRTVPQADWLVLAVTRPELIVQHGWGPGWGPRHHPKVNLQANVHPWLIADAIRWYVEHPAERDLLGTPGAQDRLLASLAGAPQLTTVSPPYPSMH